MQGLIRFGVWLVRPRVIRLAESDGEPTLVAPITAEINRSAFLRTFWETGALVENPMWGRMRWNDGLSSALLDADANPPGSWDEDTAVEVLAIALVRGEAPNREWLVFAHAPRGEFHNVAVRIPDYSEVLIDVGPVGAYYHVEESSATVKRIEALGSSDESNSTLDSALTAKSLATTGEQSASLALPNGFHWQFDGSTVPTNSIVPDVSGNGRDALVKSGSLQSVPGIIGSAKVFDHAFAAVDTWAQVPGGGFTFCTWLKPMQLPSTGRIAALFGAYDSSNRGWVLGLDPTGSVFLGVGDGAKPNWLLSKGNLPANTWRHVCAAYDVASETATLYLDGNLDAAAQLRNANLNAQVTATFGRASWADTYYLNAALDEANFYTRSLTAQEVAQLFATFPSAAPSTASRTPTAQWKLDESTSTAGTELVDASGNGNQATTVGSGTSGVAGRVNGARRFQAGYAAIALTSALQSRTFSVSTWVSPSTLPTAGRLAVIYSSFASNNTGWMIGLNDQGRIVVSVGDGTRAPWLVSSGALPLNQWRYVTATFDEWTGAAKIYIDGQLDTTGGFSDPKANTSANPVLGRASWANTYYFDGTLDELSLYSVALDGGEVANTYQSFPPAPAQNPRTAIAAWKLDEASGAAGANLVDSSGAGNGATVGGAGITPTAGRVNGGQRFQAAWATVALTPPLQSRTFSVSAWVSPSSFPSAGRLAVIYSSFASNNTGWMIGLNDQGRIVVSVGDGTRAPWLVSSGALPLNQWRYVTATFDEWTGAATIFIDGEPNATGGFSNPKANTTANPTIGRASWANTYYLDGILDELSVYPVALNGTEVLSQYASLASAPATVPSEVIISTTQGLKNVFANGVPPGTIVRLAPGDYIGPFQGNPSGLALRATYAAPIVITALDPNKPPVIHFRSSWLGPLKYVYFQQLDFTGRINIDGSTAPSGLRNYGVVLRDIRWSLCGWGGAGECLKVTKGEAMTVEHVTYFAVQAYLAGLKDIGPEDRVRMSSYTLAQVDAALAAGTNLGNSTQMPIDFVAQNLSIIRAVRMERSGYHASIQIKGGSSGNIVEDNTLSAWSVRHVALVNRNINLGGGTCELCFREEGFRQFESYNTIVRGNRIECGDACGAIAGQTGTEWTNNTHWMGAGRGNCDSPSQEQGSRWAIRLTNETVPDHMDEVRPSQNARFERNAWVYNYCSSSAEFVNRNKVCADDVDLESPGNDCVAKKTIQWKDNVVYEAGLAGAFAADAGIRHT